MFNPLSVNHDYSGFQSVSLADQMTVTLLLGMKRLVPNIKQI